MAIKSSNRTTAISTEIAPGPQARLSARTPAARKSVKAEITPQSWRTARNRGEKSELIRDSLFRAAAEVVGEVGYADASISLITSKAGVAQGTFYNYFESRQDILDQLLPVLGKQMRQHVGEKARAGHNFVEREELGFRAFFSFLTETPHFFRILNEAESLAPNAHHAHIEAVARGYTNFLRRAHADGEFPGFEPNELEVVVFMLMAARSYLPLRYEHGEVGQAELPEWVINAYMKFIKYGLMGQPSAEPPKPAKSSAGRKAAVPATSAGKARKPERKP